MPREEIQTQLESIQKTLDLICAETVESVVRLGELGSRWSFEAIADDFNHTLRFAADLRRVNLETSPIQFLVETTGIVNTVWQSITNIRRFDPQPQNAANQRQHLIEAFRADFYRMLTLCMPTVALGLHRSLDVSEAVASLRLEIDAAKEARKKTEGVLADASDILAKVRGISAETGVTAHAKAFKEQAEGNRKSAVCWQLATIGLGVITIVAAYCLFAGALKGSDTDWTQGHAIRSIAFRLVLLSFLTYFVSWCARNYRANKHNDVANRHRYLSLSSFEAFAKAAGDDKDTKNAVLLQTTQAIFGAGKSGYLDKETEPGAQNTIVEILRRSDSGK